MTIEKTRNIIRIVGISCAFVFAIGAGNAFAMTSISGGNNTTGPNSENENEWDIDNDVDIDIHNKGKLDNDFDVYVNSGKNEIEKNTKVEDISTGDISGSFDVMNKLNNADIDLSELNWGDIEIDLENHITGPCSENENEVEISREVDIDVNNYAKIDNDLDIYANTGKNDIKKNTVVGDVSTGDIDLSASIRNEVNAAQSSLDLGQIGSSDVDVDLSNGTTGPNSKNENEVKIDADVDIDVHNYASIENDYDVNANTGKNEIESNTVVGDISTGSISLDFSTVNIAN